MSSGDPLVFFVCFFVCFLPVLFSFPTSPHSCFLFSFFFHQILNCLLYLLVHFFLFVFLSISSVFFSFHVSLY